MAAATEQSTAFELLETKLFAPRWHAGMVSRPRLVRLLNDGVDRKLTLIAAPAGFGKTTLLAEWLVSLSDGEREVGWVSLDASDNEPRLFWSYVFTALRRIDSSIGMRAQRTLNAPDEPAIQPALTSLINDLIACDRKLTLVLDDFHVIETRSILQGLEFLVLNLPANASVIIASRADPALPVARLRGRGESHEIRSADLRFTSGEASAFLPEIVGHDLQAEDIAALEARTEGWIAGLQLAALSLRGRDDESEFIQTFAGDDRYIVDYLIEEVLNSQPEQLKDFLVKTAILDRLCGPLCDAIVGGDSGQASLEELERRNVFLAPLDGKRQWYRYHQLFADVLRAHARRQHAEEVDEWHRRASAWFAGQGFRDDAIRYAIAGNDVARAASLIEVAWRPMDRERRIPIWLRWVQRLPDSEIGRRPVLSAAYGWALLEEGDLEQGAAWLDTAEEQVIALKSRDVEDEAEIVADADEYVHLSGSIAAARAYHAMAESNAPAAIQWARRALDLLPHDAHTRRAAPAALLALASWRVGDLDGAAASLTDDIADGKLLGDSYIVSATFVLGEILREQGRFAEAQQMYERVLRMPAFDGEELQASTANLLTGRAEVHLCRGDLELAETDLTRSRELLKGIELPHWRHRWSVAQAGLLRARGDLSTAIAAFDDAEASYVRGPVPDVRPIPASRARVLIQLDHLTEAAAILASLDIDLRNPPDYLREYEVLSLVRLKIAHRRAGKSNGPREELFACLNRHLKSAADQKRTAGKIELLALTALAYDAWGDPSRARESLKRALDLAEPIGYVRIFVDEGRPMRDLLLSQASAGRAGPLMQRLWESFNASTGSTPPVFRHDEAGLIEPLTERELDVLRLIAAGLRNREIADELYISLATVKRHIANAYGKLQVRSRTEAVARASESGLI